MIIKTKSFSLHSWTREKHFSNLLTVWLLKQGQRQRTYARWHGWIREEPRPLTFQLGGLSTKMNLMASFKDNCFIQFAYFLLNLFGQIYGHIQIN